MEDELRKMRPDLNPEYYKSLKGKEAIQERINGARLPMLSIAGKLYNTRVAFGMLEPLDLMKDPIRIGDLEKHNVSKKLHFYLHTPTMTRVEIPEDAKAFPEGVVQVEIPNMHYLDPVGMARREGRDARYYLRDGYLHLRMFREARIIPLKNTEIAAVIRRNQGADNKQMPEKLNSSSNRKVQKMQAKRGTGL